MKPVGAIGNIDGFLDPDKKVIETDILRIYYDMHQ